MPDADEDAMGWDDDTKATAVQMLQHTLKLHDQLAGEGNESADEDLALLQLHASVAHPEGLRRGSNALLSARQRAAERPQEHRAHHRPRDSRNFYGGSTWCGYNEKPGFIKALVKPNSDDFMLDITEELSKSGVVRFMVTAMAVTGTYADSGGYLTQYAYPQEDSSSTMFEFRPGLKGAGVDVYYPQVNVRTSDNQSAEAVERGKGSGWYDTLPTYGCSKSRGPGGFDQTGNDPPELQEREWGFGPFGAKNSKVSLAQSEEDSQRRVVINGGFLLQQGFFATKIVHGAVSLRVLSVKSFPENLDVTAEFAMPDGFPMALGFSLIKLREKPMTPRVADERLLYFSQTYKDLGWHTRMPYELPRDSLDRQESIIWRYDLSRLPGQQIRICVDPTVPSRWRESFRRGIEQWNAAYAKIGLPHAVKAIVPGDSDWPADYDVADARYNTISWVISNQVVSMGIAKVDPRSGEILKSDITMSDGWVRSWLGDLDLLSPNFTHRIDSSGGFRQESLLDMSDRRSQSGRTGLLELAGELQRQMRAAEAPQAQWGKKVSLLATAEPLSPSQMQKVLGIGLEHIVAHETGHILGLRHNFKGSMGVSYNCTRSASCAAEGGLTTSVMDYLPTNAPSLGSSGASDVAIFTPVIGAYDKLAIKYGYMNASDSLPGKTLSLVPELRQVLEEAEGFETCYDADRDWEDPTCAPYDMSAEPLKFMEEQLDRLALVQKHLLNASVLPGAPYTKYGEAVMDVLSLALRNGQDAARWLGGVTNSYAYRRTDGSQGPVRPVARRAVPAEKQRKAAELVLRVMRPAQSGLLPPKEGLAFLVQAPTGEGSVETVDIEDKVRTIVKNLMTTALASTKLKRLHDFEALAPGEERSLGVGEYLTLIVNGVMPQSADGGLLDVPKADWELHAALVRELSSLYKAGAAALPEEVLSLVLQQIRGIHAQAEVSLAQADSANGDVGPLKEHLLSLRQEVSLAVCGSSWHDCAALNGVRSSAAAPRWAAALALPLLRLFGA